MNKKALLAISMLLMALASIVVEFFTVGMFMKAQAAKSWPKAAGTVTKSVVVRKESGKIQYVADVQYEYTVDDKEYENDVVRLRGTTTDSKSTAEEIVAKYPVESKIDVYYDKSDASDALLEPGADFINYIIMISPLFFAALFGMGAYGSWSERESKDAV